MNQPPPVLVGIPAVSWVYTEHVIAMMQLRLPEGSAVVYSRGGCTIADKRLRLAQMVAQDDHFGALLCLDSDMLPTPGTLVRLLSHNLPIVCPLMFQRLPPYRACAGWCDPDGRNPRFVSEFGGPEPVQRVDQVGTGCLLIRRDALVQVPKPWFDAPSFARPGCGEDTWFCLQAAKAGIPIHVDTSFCVGHLGVTSIDLDHVMAWQETAEARQRVAQAVQVNEAIAAGGAV